MPYAVLMPIFADQILHGGAQRAGHSDGRNRRGRVAGRGQPGGSRGREGAGQLIAIVCRRLRRQPDPVLPSRGIFWLSTVLLLPVGFFMMVQMARRIR